MIRAIVEAMVTGSWVSPWRFTLPTTSMTDSTIGTRISAFTRAMNSGEMSGRNGRNRNFISTLLP
jgi:hypothetical protein